ncbi:DUF262 domain-containing protein [Rhodobium gokarnense]|uniref:DUF262 domain-containing protein n=1 Tax=Rhodobium gokarnense TaxID=364296 RepID=A0ABT3HET9_9HYPH|nr:DUF262 domain-containing HNH endonuclease family protein [Rhodobium gokarnense]MCW2308913.1 hypothetical protein [Rhodobium gokarnense]
MQLNPLHLTIAGLVEGRLFRIPGYQRAYSWQKRQRQDLFADIDEAYRSGREHFMATVVALAREKRTIVADEFTAVELVDGQQRVTTLIILLKAIEKSLSSVEDGEVRAKRDLCDLLVKGDEHSLVLLQTNHDSSNVFTSYVRTGKFDENCIATASDQNLVEAFQDCERFVASWANKGKLIELLATIRNRLSLIYHELSNEATVYRVFEVLNSRGLDVRWVDKTKSQMMASIFEFSEEGARDDSLCEMRTIWQDIYRILGMKPLLGTEALRFAGTLLAASQPNRILGEEDASVALIRHGGKELAKIVETAEWLRKVVRFVNEISSDERRAAVTKIAHARFLAIAIMLRDFNKETQDRLLLGWEKVTFRIFALGGADSRMKVGEYVRLAYDIWAKKLTDTEIFEKLRIIGEDYNLKSMFRDKHYWEYCYDGWAEELRYLLFRYDEHLSEQAGEQINISQWNKIWTVEPSKSIEHIVPQSAAPDFEHHLGNLTMLAPGVNSSLQNKSPDKKADAYLSCGIRETMTVGKRIKETGEWTESEVKDRAKRIEQFALAEWGE